MNHMSPLPPVVLSLVDIDNVDLGPLRPFQASAPLYRGPRGPGRLRGDSQGAPVAVLDWESSRPRPYRIRLGAVLAVQPPNF